MEEEKYFNDKQSKVKYIVIGVLLFFVLAIIGMVYYSLTPKVILSETIKSLEYKTSKIRDKYTFKFNLSFNLYSDDKSIQPFFNIINKFDYTFVTNSNLKDNLEESVYLKYNQKDIMSLNSYYYNDEIYIKIFDKLLLIDKTDENENNKGLTEYKNNIKDLLPYLDSNSEDAKWLDKVIETVKNTIDNDNLKRKINKEGLSLTINLDKNFYEKLEQELEKIGFKEYLEKNNLKYEDIINEENFKPEKIIVKYKLNKLKYELNKITIIDGEKNVDITIDDENLYIDIFNSEKCIVKLALEKEKGKNKLIVQDDENGILLNITIEEIENKYEEVKIDTSSAKKLSEINEEDINYFIEKIGNAEGMEELINQIMLIMGGFTNEEISM